MISKSLTLKASLLVVLTSLGLGTLLFTKARTDSISLSSKKKGQRKTVLKDVKASEAKSKKDLAILLQDSSIQKKWGLQMTKSQRAWQVSQGSKDIIVAVIDTGVDEKHPDLKSNLWVNKGEIPGNNIDDDKNGFVDDVHGWNFVSDDDKLVDNHGHGTHIAGIVGAEGGNGGVTGVAPKVSLMILKYYDPKAPGSSNLNNTVKAIDYAVKMGAHIINYSGGGLEPSAGEKRAIAEANTKGILFVAAAGNERSNSDHKKYYPADYDLPNIVSVTAIDKGKNVLPSSNWGVSTVDIAAPGNDIYSTLPGGKYGHLTGTSQATAFATGVAALVMARNPTLRKANRIVKYLTQTGDVDQKLAGKTRYQRRLNSYRALALQDSDLSFSGALASNESQYHKKAFQANRQANGSRLATQGDLSVQNFANGSRDLLNFFKRKKVAPADRLN